MEDSADGAGRWWDWGLLARWIGVNAAADVVVVVGGAALELFASNTKKCWPAIIGWLRSCSSPSSARPSTGSCWAAATANPRHPDPRPAAPPGVIAALVQKENVWCDCASITGI